MVNRMMLIFVGKELSDVVLRVNAENNGSDGNALLLQMKSSRRSRRQRQLICSTLPFPTPQSHHHNRRRHRPHNTLTPSYDLKMCEKNCHPPTSRSLTRTFRSALQPE